MVQNLTRISTLNMVKILTIKRFSANQAKIPFLFRSSEPHLTILIYTRCSRGICMGSYECNRSLLIWKDKPPTRTCFTDCQRGTQ